MASLGTLSLLIRHCVRLQPDPSVSVEEVLLAVGDQVGYANLSYASRTCLKHVLSFMRQCFMFLNCPSQTLDVFFRVKHGEGQYMVYASTGSMKCLECGDVGHKHVACPHKAADQHTYSGAAVSSTAAEAAVQPDRSADLTDAGAKEAFRQKE